MIKNLEENEVSFGSIKQKLFTFKELENLLNLRPFTNNRRFISTISKKIFRWNNNCWATDLNCWPISLIEELIKEGTCYLADSSRANKKINDVANELEKKFDTPVDCHIYFSLHKGSKSFDKHKDKAHNFIVVCEGEIKFEIFSNKKITKKLKTGDYVYIPAGVYHRAVPLTDKRISCSFAIKIPLGGMREERKWLRIL
jgi:mannose-6-phosphate isomerase-like protein (cupin superfamily)